MAAGVYIICHGVSGTRWTCCCTRGGARSVVQGDKAQSSAASRWQGASTYRHKHKSPEAHIVRSTVVRDKTLEESCGAWGWKPLRTRRSASFSKKGCHCRCGGVSGGEGVGGLNQCRIWYIQIPECDSLEGQSGRGRKQRQERAGCTGCTIGVIKVKYLWRSRAFQLLPPVSDLCFSHVRESQKHSSVKCLVRRVHMSGNSTLVRLRRGSGTASCMSRDRPSLRTARGQWVGTQPLRNHSGMQNENVSAVTNNELSYANNRMNAGAKHTMICGAKALRRLRLITSRSGAEAG